MTSRSVAATAVTLHAPPQIGPEVLHRPRLTSLLAHTGELIAVLGPTGYGKTTLVASWLAEDAATEGGSSDQIAWIDVAALAAQHAPKNVGVKVCSLVADIVTRGQHAVLVIDALDAMPGIYDADLAENLRAAAGLRVVVTSRSATRHRAWAANFENSEIVEPEALLFTETETATFLLAAAPPGADVDVEQIHHATGGWPVLIAAAGTTGALAEAKAYVEQHLVPDIDTEAGQFLQRSILAADHLTASVAAVLNPHVSSANQLASLAQAGLLRRAKVAGETTYRFVPVVGDVINCRSQFTPAERKSLLSQLSRWYDDEDLAVKALQAAVRSEDWGLVLSLLARRWSELSSAPEVGELLRAIPDELVAVRPLLGALRDLVLATDEFHVITGELPVIQAPRHDLPISQYLSKMTGRAAYLRLSGHITAATELVDKLRNLLRRGERAQIAEAEAVLPTMILQWGITRLMAGELIGAASDLHDAYRRAQTHGPPFALKNAAGALALLYVFAGDVPRAETWLAVDAQIEHTDGIFAHLAATSGHVARALLAIERLDLPAAQAALVAAGNPTRRNEMWPFMAFAHAELALSMNEARSGLAQLEAIIDAHRGFRQHETIADTLLRAAGASLLLAAGDGGRASAVLARGREGDPFLRAPRARLQLLTDYPVSALRIAGEGRWKDHGYGRNQVELRLLTAVAQLALGRRDVAAASFKSAVELAGPCDLVRPFTLVDRDALTELVALSGAGRELVDDAWARSAGPVYPAKVDLIELTPRERVVLSRLAAGMTQLEIAEHLVVSPNTIKTQTRSIYRKFGVTSRREALAIAADLGLIPPIGK